jgi:ATP-dependent Clp protease protease subunit
MRHFRLQDDIQAEEINVEELEQLMAGGDATVNYEDREIIINGVINATAMEKYIMPIIAMNKEDDDNEVPIEERQPITLYISCVGGDVSMGLALVDVIQASKTLIIGVTVSYAYSMGCSIHLACHERYCFKRSMFLIHDRFVGNEPRTSKFKDFIKFLTIQEKQLKNLILSTTKITKNQLNKKFATEWYIDAEEALKLGMIDAILTNII